MYGWIIKVCATAVVLNIISYIIPNGRIKSAALVAMGFMFVTIILPPIRLAKNELLNKKYFIEAERNILVSQVKQDDYSTYDEIINAYKKRLETEIKGKLSEKGYALRDINITVNCDEKNEEFGKVINVVVAVSANAKEENRNINRVEIPEIVIDRNGISIDVENESDNEKDMKEDEKIVKEIINNFTGVSDKYIKIRWE